MEGFLVSLIGATCAQRFAVEGAWTDSACLKLALSKVLGYGIILGSMAFKVPQIIKILQAKRSFGISLLSNVLENVICISNFAYNFTSGNPFSTYGDSFFVFVQNSVIIFLIFFYSDRKKVPLALGIIAAFSIAGAVMSLYVPLELLAPLQASSIALLIGARLKQIMTVFQNKSTGDLSFLTCLLQLLGTSGRVFTTIQEVDDLLMLAASIAAAALSFLLVAQFFLFKSGVPPPENVEETKKGK